MSAKKRTVKAPAPLRSAAMKSKQSTANENRPLLLSRSTSLWAPGMHVTFRQPHLLLPATCFGFELKELLGLDVKLLGAGARSRQGRR